MSADIAQRKHNRLKNYDYSSPGYYFITVCIHNKKKILSEIVTDNHRTASIKLTSAGKIVDEVIKNIPSRYNVNIHKYVIMPNHVHFIIIIEKAVLCDIGEPTVRIRKTLDKLIGYIKMNSSKQIHQTSVERKIWQRSITTI